ncbi:MAG: single-stranded-DNA-specific exonuclease RecJ [Bryobacteraceae bacterium]|nr:single-stranded-DNA-specific exonuclease RecJ [Bryobacteraceae bacterium]
MNHSVRWTLPDIDTEGVERLARQCGLERPAARVLWARGLREAGTVDPFLHPKLSNLEDPFLLSGMDAAVERVLRAVRDGERILIYGDYDVDGTSSIVILKLMLERLGASASFHIPNRLKDGYGIQTDVLEEAARDGVKLLISVDTGIRALEPLRRAEELGLDVIVTDHHLPEEELPPAVAILNPNRPGCAYPNKALCGAGVTFKLIQALMERAGMPPDRIVKLSDSLLVLVAIATVADVVGLTGENRVMVKRGLEGLTRTRNKGLRALLASAGLELGDPVSATDVGFRLGPRINAAGRMDHAADVIELFLTPDEGRAHEIAQRLDALNAERQRTCEAIVEQIFGELGEPPLPPERAGLVFYDPEWHRGVVGIVANRVAEAYHRPALVLGRDGSTGMAQGSGRSIAGFHLLGVLETIGDVFERFGGHRAAVGVTLRAERVDELRERFNAAVVRALTHEELQAEVVFDAPLDLRELTPGAAEQVLQMAPFGFGNPAPVFYVPGVELTEPVQAFGSMQDHLRVRLPGPQGRTLTAKAWRFGSRAQELAPGRRVDLALTVDQDLYSLKRGYAGWGVTLRDVRAAE